MKGNQNKQFLSQSRRELISNGFKLVLLSAILSPLEQACNSKTKSKGPGNTDTSSQKKNTTSRSKKKRQKWSHESLLINSKTGVIHLPSSTIYHYYDEIKASHIKEIVLAGWMASLDENSKINKQQSGNILEVAALQQLKNGINDQSLSAATDTLSTAFSEKANNKSGKNLNETNFRLHELMLQLVTLNNMVPKDAKWQTFLAKVKMPTSLRKRQAWMSSETMFNNRVNYIAERNNEYLQRLSKRAGRYSFT